MRYLHKLNTTASGTTNHASIINFNCIKCDLNSFIFKDEILGNMESVSDDALREIEKIRRNIYCEISDEEYKMRELLR